MSRSTSDRTVAPRAAVALLTLSGLVGGLMGCSGSPSEVAGAPDTATEAARGRGDGASRRDALGERLAAMPAVPDVLEPAAVARRLRFLDSVLGDRQAAARHVRRAAELDQLTTRTVAMAGPALGPAVRRRLDPALARRVAADVAAARRLTSLTTPQPQLPDWRVVAPPTPERLLRAYRLAQRRTGVGWHYLAAIHLVETRMGRIRGVSTAGAQGPMQFLPATWDIYGAGGDIADAEDAVMAAARLLKANGAPADMPRAIWHYNHSDDYVFAVTRYALNLRRDPQTYRGYWHWRVLYLHAPGTKVLPVGYPRRSAVPLRRS